MADNEISVEEYRKEVGKEKRESTAEVAMEQMLDTHGIAYERELRFAPPRRWRFDFAWPHQRIALEIEGLVRPGLKSRHTTNDGFRKDMEKYNMATLMGWRVIRVDQRMVNSGEALRLVEIALGRDDGTGYWPEYKDPRRRKRGTQKVTPKIY